MTKTDVPEASLEDLKQWFSENQDKPRIVALMSPTCGFCLIGHQAVRTYNAWLQGEDFATKRVWIPMMAPDGIQDAEGQAATTQDPRITDMYDATHVVGRAYRDVLRLAAVAWDTYMIYERGIQWTGEMPPEPTRVQYQLWSPYAPDQSRLFTPSDFWWTVVELVGRSKGAYEAEVPALAAWLNDDHEARIGLEVPARYRD